MTDQGFAAYLQAVLDGEMGVNESFDPDDIRRVVTYQDAGVLTMNAGLVVTMDDGAEHQITIVRSR